MQKNVAGQKWTVFAFGGNSHSTPGDPVTGDAAQITAQLSKDGGIAVALGDTNPVERGAGYYVFDITQAESDADHLNLIPASATPDVLVVGAPGALYTTPANFPALIVSAAGIADARLAADVVHGGGNQTQMLIDNSAGTGDAWLAHGGTGIANAGFRVTSESTSGVGMSCTGQFAGANFIGLGANAEGMEIEGVGTDAALKLVAASGSPVDYDGIELLAAIWAHDAANRLMEGARQLRPFTVGAAPTASSIPTDITGAPYSTTDHFKGRIVTINEEAKTIIGSSGSPVILTVSDFVSVPSQNDLGVIS